MKSASNFEIKRKLISENLRKIRASYQPKKKIEVSVVKTYTKEQLKHHAYKNLHNWIGRNFGRPSCCEFCGASSPKKGFIKWSNKDHKYSKDRNDWQALCNRCHVRYDIKMGFRKSTTKGKKLKVGINTYLTNDRPMIINTL